MTVNEQQLLKIEFYVPETHLEAVKMAMFAAGAGRVGNYDCCAWQTAGQGQFRPLDGSQPFTGQTGRVESVPEYKVEMVCRRQRMEDVLRAMRDAHPYEEVAYGVMELDSSSHDSPTPLL